MNQFQKITILLFLQNMCFITKANLAAATSAAGKSIVKATGFLL